MRAGLATSVAAHVLVLAWGLFGLTSTKPFDPTTVESMPVDLVPISALTSLQQGKKTAEVKPKPSPNKPTAVDTPKPTPAPTPPKPTPPVTPPPPPPPPPPPKAEPQPPKPDPTPPAPKPDPTPPPPKPDPTPPKPDPTPPPPEPAPQPKPDPAPTPEPKVAEETPPPPAPKPRVKPPAPKPEVQPTQVAEAKTPPVKTPVKTPAKPKPTQQATADKDSEFDPDKMQALIDRSKPTGSTKAAQLPEAFGAEEAKAPSTAMTQSEVDALRSQIQGCWNIPVGWTDPKQVTVTLNFSLNQDGTVSGQPTVSQYPPSQYGVVAAENATRAVLQCGPYNLPAAKYDQWKDVEMTFSPQG